MSAQVRVVLNGTERQFAAPLTVAGAVAAVTDRNTGVAVAVGETVVPRSAWDTTALHDGDRVEILTAVQGG